MPPSSFRRRTGRRLAAALVLAATGVAVPSTSASAAGISVDTAAEAAVDGRCSLREALLAADTDRRVDACAAGAGVDEVLVPQQARDLVLSQGALTVRSSVTVRGAAVLRQGATDELAPLVHVVAGASVTLSGLTLAGSTSTAVLNEGALTASGITVRDGQQGLDVDGSTAAAVTNRGRATLDRVTVSGNALRTTAVLNAAGATMSVRASTLTGNVGEFGGSPALSNAGTLTVTRTAQSGSDLGLVNTGTATVTDSSLRDNGRQGLLNSGTARLVRTSVAANGLGIDNAGRLTVEHSAVRDNRGLRLPERAGGVENSGDLRLLHSAVVGNTGRGTGGVRSRGALVLSDVTVAQNTADSLTSADVDELANPDGAGGVTVVSGTARLTNVTLARNTYAADPALDPARRASGGLTVLSGTVSVANTVVAANRYDAAATTPGRDCAGPLTSRGYNLFAPRTGCAAALATGDTTGRDPRLGALAENGGRTPTLLPAATSPLVDRGSPAVAGGAAADACTASDERGVRRPTDGNGDGVARCDIGAVERRAAPATP